VSWREISLATKELQGPSTHYKL